MISPLTEGLCGVVEVQKTAITIIRGNGKEDRVSRESLVLAPTTVEDTTSERSFYPETEKETGIWSLLNHKEPMTAVVRSQLKLSPLRTTRGIALPNSEEGGAPKQEEDQLYTVERVSCT